jgi:chemotaxis protein MotA
MAGNPPTKKRGGIGRPDLATIGGLLLALGGILGGLLLEGGKVQDVAQVTAAMIVLGGTIGAVMVTTPMPVLVGAAKKLSLVFFNNAHPHGDLIEEIIGYATKARKSSIVSLEDDLETMEDPFLKKALSLAVDGMELQQLRQVMELQITQDEKRGEAEAKVFEAAGGYAPTVGIIGAVLGLIQVMKHLENIEEVGHGIAVAFVATVYGVGVANLLFLPAASKIKARVQHGIEAQELLLEGVCSIVEGLNPKLIRSKLEAFVEPGGARKKAAKGGRATVGEAASA